MSRPNPKRRWRAKQKALQAEQFAQILSETLAHGDDSEKLQRGSPSYTSADTYAKHARLSGFRDTSERTPQRGKVQGGKFVPDRGSRKRFGRD